MTKLETKSQIVKQDKNIKTFEVNFKHVCYFGLALPLGAFISCVILSIVKDFQSANQTHCYVFNFFPSISSCISGFYPQTTIWRLFIGIDSFPRYVIAFIYYTKYYSAKIPFMKRQSTYRMLINTAFIFHIIELTSLLMLTYVSSDEIFFVHMISFILFLITSSIYMILTIATYYWPRELENSDIKKIHSNLTPRELNSKKYKTRVFLFYMGSFMFSLYFYIRHNKYCEPYVYSFFSLCEYFTVLANIIYHSIIIYDLDLNSNSFRISLLERKND